MIDKNELVSFTKKFTSNLYSSGYISETEKLQADAAAVQVSTLVERGTSKGGFKALSSNVVEGEAFTKGPSIALLTNDGPAKIELTNTKTASQNSLTGKPSANGQLIVAVSQASPAAMKKVLTDVVKSDDSVIKSVAKETSSQPNLVDKAIDKNPVEEVSRSVQEKVDEGKRRLGQPIASSDPFGSLGGKFGNILASVASLISGGSSFKEVGEEIFDKTTEIVDPSTGDIRNPNIVNLDGTTNTSKTVSKGSFLSENVKATDTPFNASENGLNFNGLLGSLAPALRALPKTEYKFEPVDTAEELELELNKSKRELTTVVTSWLKFPINFNGTMEKYSEFIKKRDTKELQTLGIDPSFLAGVEYGVQEHYVIMRNGRVIRGRPLDKEIRKKDNTWTKGVISVAFWAGSTEPYENPKWKSYMSVKSISTDQWKAYDIICETFLKSFPGGSIVSLDRINASETPNPGFNAAEYVKGKFGKESIYDDDEDYMIFEPYTAEEKSEKRPKTVVATSADPSEIPNINEINKKLKNLQSSDPLTGNKLPIDIDTITSQYGEAIKGAQGALREKNGIIDEASKVGTGLLGSLSKKASTSDTSLTSLLNTAQSLRKKAIDNGYTYDPTTNSWNK
jgi:hypothetical protein